MSRARVLPYAALAALALIWGASFLLIKVAVQDLGPIPLVFLRAVSGAVTLAVITRAMGRPLVSTDWKKLIGPFVIMAVTNAILPWAAIAWGEERISSGVASILNATTTLWAAIFIYWVVPSERPSAINYLGVLIGIAGVATLVSPDIVAHGFTGNFLGAAAVVVAAMSYAVSALYQRVRLRGMNIFEQSLGQIVVTAALALPIAIPALPHVRVAALSLAAVIALGVGATAFGYLLYYYTMNSLGAVRATGVTFLVPMTAVFWGVVLLRESLSAPIIVGMVVILAGIVLTNLRGTRRAVSETRAA